MTAMGRGRVWREGGNRGGVWRENGGAFGGRRGAARCWRALARVGRLAEEGEASKTGPVIRGLGWSGFEIAGLYGSLNLY